MTVRRYEQYEDSLRQDRAFQRKWMVPITVGQGRRAVTIDAHVGVRPVRSDSARELKAVLPDGVISYASQTHPADGTAGMIVTAEAQARELGADGPFARVLASGFARVAPGTMPKAPVPAAIAALDAAGIRLGDVDVIKTHNPFVVNDLWFARELGADVAAMNPYGCSLIYGHPQGPTGARAVVELSMHLRSAAAAAGCSPAAPPVIPARPWSSRCSTRLATSPGRKRELRTAAPARRGRMTGSPDEWPPHYTDIYVSPGRDPQVADARPHPQGANRRGVRTRTRGVGLPAADVHTSPRSSPLRTLPTGFRGRASTIRNSSGSLYGASRSRAYSASSASFAPPGSLSATNATGTSPRI